MINVCRDHVGIKPSPAQILRQPYLTHISFAGRYAIADYLQMLLPQSCVLHLQTLIEHRAYGLLRGCT